MESSNGAARTIGRMACESGLSVSVLRFYDGAGVLTPASVDPDTGYRYYAPDQVVVARLVASLRRVGMPLAPAGCPHRGDRTDLGSIMRL